MIRKQSLLLSAFLALVAVGYMVWGTGAREVVIAAPDGNAALTVAKNALPAGFDASLITINALPRSEDALATYELGPDGMQFKKPVTLSATFPLNDESDLPLLLSLDEDDPVIVDNIEYDIDTFAGTVTLRAPLVHFSRYTVVGGFFRLRQLREGGVHAVGERFPVAIPVFVRERLHVNAEMRDGSRRALTYLLAEDPQVKVNWTAAAPTLSLSRFINEPVVQAVPRSDFTLSEEFDCDRVGEGAVRASIRLNFAYKVYLSGADPSRARTWTNSVALPAYSEERCVAAADTRGEVAGRISSESGSILDDIASDDPRGQADFWLRIGDAFYPGDRFYIANGGAPEVGHECRDKRGALAMHYHAHDPEGVQGVYNFLELSITPPLVDPDPNGCGYGFVTDIERLNVERIMGGE